MGLEAATYITDLDIGNPLAADRKNQGDDHLRLLKAVLKASFPNLDRAYRVPEVGAKSTAYTIVLADENKFILCDSAAAGFNLTLPVGATLPDGWAIDIMITTGTNPVFVVPPSGAISGIAKVRVQIPSRLFRFMWDGSTYRWLIPEGDAYHGQITWFAGGSVPTGFGLANGQSLSRLDHPVLFAVWGVGFGAVDGNSFNAPDLRDRFIVGAGSIYALAATGGEAAHVLAAGEVPTHDHDEDTPDHFHIVTTGVTSINYQPGGSSASGLLTTGSGNAFNTSGTNVRHQHASFGSGTAHENRPPYFGLYPIFRLC